MTEKSSQVLTDENQATAEVLDEVQTTVFVIAVANTVIKNKEEKFRLKIGKAGRKYH